MIDMRSDFIVDRPGFVPQPPPSFVVDPPGSSSGVARLQMEFTPEGGAIRVSQVTSHREEAIDNSLDDMVEVALDRLRRNVKRFPLSPLAHVNLATALLNFHRLDEAAREFEESIRIDPDYYPAALGITRLRVLENQLDEADKLLRQLQIDHPKDPMPWTMRADIAVRQGRFEEAIVLSSKAAKLAHDLVPPRLICGVAFLSTNRHQKAIQQFKQAVTLDIRSASLQHALGVAYALAGDNAHAAKAFRAALNLAPLKAESVHGLVEVLLRQRDYSAVMELLRDHLEKRPEDYKALELLSRAYIELRRFDDARLRLVMALQQLQAAVLPDAEKTPICARLMNNLGVCYRFLDRWNDAESWFQRSIQTLPDGAAYPYHNLARLYLETNREHAARGILRECAVRFPNDEDTPVLLAASLEQAGKYDEARRELEELIRGGSAPAEAYRALSGLLIDALHRPQEAVPVLVSARNLFPDNLNLTNNLAYAHLMAGHVEEARMILQSLPAGAKGIAAIVLRATWGLLRLSEGNVEGGKRGYDEAEQEAKRQGRYQAVPFIRQKKYLELARFYAEAENIHAARKAVKAGRRLKASKIYTRDLEHLAEVLRAAGDR